MTTQDKVKVIAEYDGMSTFKTEHDLFFKRGVGCTPENYDYHLLHLKYLTSLDWLHPVALRVLNNLVSEFNISTKFNTYVCASDHIANIKKAMYKPPVNGEYRDLLNAVYDGIEFLNRQKK